VHDWEVEMVCVFFFFFFFFFGFYFKSCVTYSGKFPFSLEEYLKNQGFIESVVLCVDSGFRKNRNFR